MDTPGGKALGRGQCVRTPVHVPDSVCVWYVPTVRHHEQ